MKAAALLGELRRRDIRVWASGGELHCSAPRGALTADMRAQLQEHKDEILRLLASAEALTAQPRAIVPLQREGSQPAVFAVPGHNGDVFCYRALAQALGPAQPFFGLQPPGLDGESKPLRRVEDLAAYFASQVRAFQPDGPYVIAGFCAGGTVAFELARQLLRDGAKVSLLALFGSPYPSYFRLRTQFALRLAGQAARLANIARALAFPADGSRRRYLEEKFHQQRARRMAASAARRDPVLVRRAEVELATLYAVRRYATRRFEGRLCLFLPGSRWQRSGVAALRWRLVAAQAEEYYGPDVSTGSNMLREHAPAFAELFARCRQSIELPEARATGDGARAPVGAPLIIA